MAAALIVSFIFFMLIVRVLVSYIFTKVNTKDYEDRLKVFLDKQAILAQKRLNRQ